MSKFALKVPPVPLTIAFGLLMWLVSLALPDVNIPDSIRYVAAGLLAAVGTFFAVAGVYSFHRAKTTVNPRKPDATSALVTSGVYRCTRNPMYVGFFCALLAWGAYLSNLWALLLPVCYVAYMNLFQIQPEERVLEETFGKNYVLYKHTVRRWI